MRRIIVPTPFEPRCDFCSETPVLWRYPAKTFTNDIGITPDGKRIIGQSNTDWAACQTCHGLIAADNRAELTERSLSTLPPEIRELDPAGARLMIIELHEGFWRNRTGPPRSTRQ